MKYDIVFTVGCFDRFHKGHATILENMLAVGKRLIVGIHDNESIQILKQTTNVQPLQKRMQNLKRYTKDIFPIYGPDPTPYIKQYIEERKLHLSTLQMVFIRGNDNQNFPGKAYVKTVMDIQFRNYTQSISSTSLRDPSNIRCIWDTRLQTVSKELQNKKIAFCVSSKTQREHFDQKGCWFNEIWLEIEAKDWTKISELPFKKRISASKVVLLREHATQQPNCVLVCKENISKCLDTVIINGNEYPFNLQSSSFS